MSFYLLMLAALVVGVRTDARGQSRSVWLDCAVGSLGAASVLAVVLSPVLASALTGSWSMATAAAVANPLLDLVLVAAVAGIFALRGLRAGDRWIPLLAGLLVMAGADVVTRCNGPRAPTRPEPCWTRDGASESHSSRCT